MPLREEKTLRKEIPGWAVAVVIALLLAVVGYFGFRTVTGSSGEKVVPIQIGDNANPFGTKGKPGQAGTPPDGTNPQKTPGGGEEAPSAPGAPQ